MDTIVFTALTTNGYAAYKDGVLLYSISGTIDGFADIPLGVVTDSTGSSGDGVAGGGYTDGFYVLSWSNSTNYITKYNTTTGARIWRTDVGAYTGSYVVPVTGSAMAVGNGILYAAFNSIDIIRLNTSDGSPTSTNPWISSATINSDHSGWSIDIQYYGQIVYLGGYIYFPITDDSHSGILVVKEDGAKTYLLNPAGATDPYSFSGNAFVQDGTNVYSVATMHRLAGSPPDVAAITKLLNNTVVATAYTNIGSFLITPQSSFLTAAGYLVVIDVFGAAAPITINRSTLAITLASGSSPVPQSAVDGINAGFGMYVYQDGSAVLHYGDGVSTPSWSVAVTNIDSVFLASVSQQSIIPPIPPPPIPLVIGGGTVSSNNLDYSVEYAGVPFLVDRGFTYRMERPEGAKGAVETGNIYRKQQSEFDLIDELNRILPREYLADFSPPMRAGRSQTALGQTLPDGQPDPQTIRICDYYYPNKAVRWSVYRGLATSSMVKAMLAETLDEQPATFTLKQIPISPKPRNADLYTVTTQLYMLPARPLGEMGGTFDGLYLVTLVDERWYFPGTPSSLVINQNTTWAQCIQTLANDLGITITMPTIPLAYGSGPEADSQLWSVIEEAAPLLDAIAASLGRIVVRGLNGVYSLLNATDSLAIAETNRGPAANVVRTTGGKFFVSGSLLPVGDTRAARNAIVPNVLNLSFPKYVYGFDPVPHLMNDRYANQRPSAWFEDGYGDAFVIPVPIQSGGPLVSGLLGVSGISISTIRDTAKALYPTEASAVSGGIPSNYSGGLLPLALQTASDYYGQIVAFALDEVYPGIFNWTPEGINDIVWTHSERARQAVTRVMHSPWNEGQVVAQHCTPSISGGTNTPVGVGGHSVAQTWRDRNAISAQAVTSGPMTATQTFIGISGSLSQFPGTTRWRGTISTAGVSESVLFEGTSGGLPGNNFNIVYRGIDGTIPQSFPPGAAVALNTPSLVYGANLVTAGGGLSVAPGAWTSGGISEAIIYVGTGGISSGMIASGVVPPAGGGSPASGGTINYFNITENFYFANIFNINSGYIAITNSGDTSAFLVIYVPFEICGYQYWCCKNATINGTLSGWAGAGAATVWDVTATSGSVLNGVVPTPISGGNGPELHVVTIVGSGSQLTVNHLNAGTTAANQIALPPGYSGSMTAKQYDSFGLWWDYCTDNVWKVIWSTVPYSGAVSAASTVPFLGARVYAGSGAQTISGGGNGFQAIQYTTKRYDTGTPASFFGTGASGTRLTAPTTGYYHMGFNLEWQGSDTGSLRDAGIFINGSTATALVRDRKSWNSGYTGPNSITCGGVCDYRLNSGDFIEVYAEQDSPGAMGALPLVVDSNFSPEFWVRLISSG